ncbi:hypothetical protein Q6249_28140, partial [Klebsiella pneumoniae]|nr:hypothetical protein [Klebsiella pneumoniae]
PASSPILSSTLASSILASPSRGNKLEGYNTVDFIGSYALITMPGASKFYRSSGAQALVRQQLTLALSATGAVSPFLLCHSVNKLALTCVGV